MAVAKEIVGDVIRHPDYHFNCESIAQVVDVKTVKLITDLGNKYLPPLTETYARQIFKALEVFVVDFLPSNTTKPAVHLLSGDLTKNQK